MTPANATADPNPTRTRLRVATLHRWAAAAVELARGVVAESRRDLGEAARRVMRIAQAGRLAIALALRLAHPDNPAFQPVPARPRGPRPAASDARPEPADEAERQRPAPVGEREVSDDALLRRPLKAIVALICRNLGLVPDWSLWSDAAEAPSDVEAAASAQRPCPAPNLQPRHPQGLVLIRPPDAPRVWTPPSERSPAAPRLRAPLRSSASFLALDPIVSGRAVTPACLPLLGARASGPR